METDLDEERIARRATFRKHLYIRRICRGPGSLCKKHNSRRDREGDGGGEAGRRAHRSIPWPGPVTHEIGTDSAGDAVKRTKTLEVIPAGAVQLVVAVRAHNVGEAQAVLDLLDGHRRSCREFRRSLSETAAGFRGNAAFTEQTARLAVETFSQKKLDMMAIAAIAEETVVV